MDGRRAGHVLLALITALLLALCVDSWLRAGHSVWSDSVVQGVFGKFGSTVRSGNAWTYPPDWVMGNASLANIRRGSNDPSPSGTPHNEEDSGSEESGTDDSEEEGSEPDESEAESSEGEDEDDEDNRREYADLNHAEKQKMLEESHNRGLRLLCLFQNLDNAVRSPFRALSDLADWGWVAVDYYAMDAQQFKDTFKVQDLYKDRQLDAAVPPNIRVDWVHSKDTSHVENGQNVEYPATDAEYFNIINGKDGIIIAHESTSPRGVQALASDKDPIKRAPLPKLGQWSDATFLSWQAHVLPTRWKLLRFVLRYCVVNLETKATVELVLAGMNAKLLDYPGRKFEKSSDPREQSAFESLVGTPNVQGVAWLLLQHVEALGPKTIKSISVWQNYRPGQTTPPDGLTPNILIEVGPADSPHRRG